MPPPSRFDTIPPEILSNIAQYLDTTSASSFSFLSRKCAAAAEASVWRYIDLTTAPRVINERQLCQRAKQLLAHGGPRRWGLVRSIKAWSTPKSLQYLFRLLEVTQDDLGSLEILPAALTLRDLDDEDIEVIDDLAIRALRCGPELSFPNLVHLRLIRVTRIVGYIPYLCSLAPRLESLDFDIHLENHFKSEDWGSPLHTLTPDVPRSRSGNDHLQSLRMLFRGHGVQDHGETDVRDILVDLLECSPRLRQLSVLYSCSDEYDADEVGNMDEEPFYAFLKDMSGLRDLHWQTDWLDIPDSDDHFVGVRRLLIKLDCWLSAHQHPILPALEILYFDCSHLDYGFQPNFHSIFSPQTLVEFFSDPEITSWIRSNPSLRLIHLSQTISNPNNLAVFDNLDALESSGRASIVVSSIRHGESEILHIRVLTQDIGVPSFDVPNVGEVDKRAEIKGRFYIAGGAADDMAHGVVRSEPVVHDLSYWGGTSVPLEALEKMRVVEGLSKQDWDRRGVEVGDEAWQVLLDWEKKISTYNVELEIN